MMAMYRIVIKLKLVRNVMGMVPWRRLVACYSCFMLYNEYVCLYFAAMCDDLHHIVISHSLLWNLSRFGVIFFIHDAKSLHRILLVHYNGFCDSWLLQQSGKYLGPISISDKTCYRKISWSLGAARFVFICPIFLKYWGIIKDMIALRLNLFCKMWCINCNSTATFKLCLLP